MLKLNRTQALLYLPRSCDLPPSPGHPCEGVLCSLIIKQLDLLYFCSDLPSSMGFPGGSVVKNCLPMQETEEIQFRSLGGGDPLEKEMATHSSILAWRIPWTEEPGGSQSMGLHRVRHDWSNFVQEHVQWPQYKSLFRFSFIFIDSLLTYLPFLFCFCIGRVSLPCKKNRLSIWVANLWTYVFLKNVFYHSRF